MVCILYVCLASTLECRNLLAAGRIIPGTMYCLFHKALLRFHLHLLVFHPLHLFMISLTAWTWTSHTLLLPTWSFGLCREMFRSMGE